MKCKKLVCGCMVFMLIFGMCACGKKEKAKEVDEYIDGVLNNDRRSLDNNEHEKKRDLLFGVANKAEESLY